MSSWSSRNYKITKKHIPINVSIQNTYYKKRIIIATMCKNEDDIVREWIEYHGSIFGFENLYIIDNESTDDTFKICQEYLSRGIHLEQKPDYLLKGEYMTYYKNIIPCDIFIPIDIDEFIVYYKNTISYENIVSYLNSLKTNVLFKMNYINPIKTNNEESLKKFTHGIYIDYKDLAKTFFKNTGNYLSYNIDHGNHMPTMNYILSDLCLVHFHKRSDLQHKKKVINNVLGLGYKLDINELKKLPSTVAGWHHVKMCINMLEYPEISNEPELESPHSIPLDEIFKMIYKIKIKDCNGKIIDIDQIEKPEQDLANKYILENDVVLELGARYGSVSCTINNKLKNKNNQVVVEPDDRVWESLEYNKKSNNCDFHIIKGFISNKKLSLTNINECLDGYGSTFIHDNNSNIPSYSLDEIIEKYNLNFNVLVADCEGFLEVFFDENPFFYDNLRLIIFEADYPEKCNYSKIKNKLNEMKFTKLLEGHQNVWIK